MLRFSSQAHSRDGWVLVVCAYINLQYVIVLARNCRGMLRAFQARTATANRAGTKHIWRYVAQYQANQRK